MELRSSQKCGICHEQRNNAVCAGSCIKKSHFFCETCLITWARTNSTCPICRAAFNTIVTPHGYTMANQVKASALVQLTIRYEDQPERPDEVLAIHLSWLQNMSDVVGVLSRFPRQTAKTMLQQLHVTT